MARRLLSILFLLAVGCESFAQVLCSESGEKHWEAGFLSGLNTDGWQADFSLAYFPVQYFGVKASLGFAGEIEALSDWCDEYRCPAYNDYASRFKFTPALVFRTGRVIEWKKQDAGFYLFAEPGLVMSPGAPGSDGAKWLRWDLKAGVNMQVERFIVTLGYAVSNFSLYSGFPTNHWGDPDTDNYITHSCLVAFAIKF